MITAGEKWVQRDLNREKNKGVAAAGAWAELCEDGYLLPGPLLRANCSYPQRLGLVTTWVLGYGSLGRRETPKYPPACGAGGQEPQMLSREMLCCKA